jgi:hypothetical protein
LCVADVLVCHDKAKLAHEDVRQPRGVIPAKAGIQEMNCGDKIGTVTYFVTSSPGKCRRPQRDVPRTLVRESLAQIPRHTDRAADAPRLSQKRPPNVSFLSAGGGPAVEGRQESRHNKAYSWAPASAGVTSTSELDRKHPCLQKEANGLPSLTYGTTPRGMPQEWAFSMSFPSA